VSNSPTASNLRRCVFFDRDGVINRSPGEGYVLSIDAFVLNDGVGDLLRSIHDAGWMSIVITSQRCVGKGLIDLNGLETIHASMQKDLMDRFEVNFDAIYAFTGLPGSESWEKPNPSMIDCASMDHSIDLDGSIMIGDRDRDIEMARRAGVGRTVRLAIDGDPVKIEADETVGTMERVGEVVSAWIG
jgi:D-glycero-D-manno-heptose 1,7-bisphosphate phosphatase